MLDLTGRRLLVVEDEELIGMMLVDLLQDFGAQALGPASTAADALAMAETEGLSAALLDLSLKGEMSYPIADRLAERGVPFIFITGYGQGHIVPRHAAVPLLTKPFGPRQLADALTRLAWPQPGDGR